MRCKGAATNTAALLHFCGFRAVTLCVLTAWGRGLSPKTIRDAAEWLRQLREGKNYEKFACAALGTALLASMLAACGSSASTTPAASSADTSSDTGASSIEAAASTGLQQMVRCTLP